MPFSEKQQEFFLNATHRWNIKEGATRSGKTYMDYFVIPKRIRACTGSGLIVLIGNTQGTLERNILEPMRNKWGDTLVGRIGANNSVRLFGKKAFAFGADNKTAVKRIQGSSIEYGYGDEVTTWAEEVFQMLKTRLDKANSVFDGTCNPDNPNHWFKKFLDSDADIYRQTYKIDDNPFLTKAFTDSLKRELEGTVYYDRYINGLWVAAEGVIYQSFAADPHGWDLNKISLGEIMQINIGVDFGGTKSGTAFVATAITHGYHKVIVLKSRKHQFISDPDHLGRVFVEFAKEISEQYGLNTTAYCDNAETILIAGLKKAVERSGIPCSVRGAAKTSIIGRIRLTSGLISQRRLYLLDECESLRKALQEALWVDKSNADERLDNGTTDIDTLDAFEYTIEREAKRLIDSRIA